MSDKFLRLPQVIEMTGLSRSTIYLRMNEGTFPCSYKIGEYAVAWLESDIEGWIKQITVNENEKIRHNYQ